MYRDQSGEFECGQWGLKTKQNRINKKDLGFLQQN